MHRCIDLTTMHGIDGMQLFLVQPYMRQTNLDRGTDEHILGAIVYGAQANTH